MSFLIQIVRAPRANIWARSLLILGVLIISINLAFAGDKAAMQHDWEVARSVPDEFGGTKHFVLIPEAKQRDSEYYKAIGDALCKVKTQCSVNFWTDRNYIPQSAWMPVRDLAVMTGSYEWYPSYTKAEIHLACWLYPTKAIGESMQCNYEPGAKVPPEK